MIAIVAGSAIIAQAAAKDDLSAATQKLADSDNYAWTSTPAQAPGGGGGGGGGRGRGGFGGGPVSGKAEKDGIIYISMAGRGGTTTEAYVKGDKVAIKGDAGWQSASEATAAADAAGGGGGFNPMTFTITRIQAIKAPADQVKDWLSKIGDVTLADGAYTADLSPEVAQAMMPRFGGRGGRGGGGGGAPPAAGADAGAPPAGPTFTDVKGTLKFWVTDGVLSKYESHITGTMSFNGNDRPIDTDTTTEITGVGSTPLNVPDDAKAKLQ
jgi:hypothetical protein